MIRRNTISIMSIIFLLLVVVFFAVNGGVITILKEKIIFHGEDRAITVGKSGSVNYLTSNYKTDDACIQAALNAAKSGDTIIIYEGNYNIKKQVSQQNKDLRIVGKGNVTFNINTGVLSQPAFYFYGKVIDTEYLAINAAKGKAQVVLNDASNVRKSDLIQIWKNIRWCPEDYSEQKTGEMYLVESVNGNTVTLNQSLIRDYSRSENSASRIYRPIRIQIENLKFQNHDSTGDLEGLALRYCKDSSIINCSFDDNGQASIRLYSCFNVEVTGNSISDSNCTGRGYGVSIADATAFVNIHNNRIENCRHCIMSGTANYEALNRNVTISNNTFVGSSVADANVIDAHPMTIDYTVTGNIVYPKPGFYAFYDGTLESVFSDNHVYGGGGVKRRNTS
jgi:parallel beta-helix repeat protein